MPLWVKLLILGIGLLFLAVGVGAGVFGTRQAQAHVALVERLRPLSAAAFEDQPVGAEALVEGTVSGRNRAVFRSFVAYTREKFDVTTDNNGNTTGTWRVSGGETPSLALDAGGPVTVGNASYSIERGHELWYDDATLGFNEQPRDGSMRYTGLVAGGPVVAFGTVAEGREGKELNARSLFGGTRAEFLASQRDAATALPIIGGVFGGVGLLLAALGGWFVLRR